MQRSGPPILVTVGDAELSEAHRLCLLCRAPASTRVPCDLAEGAILDGRFEQLGKLPLCAPCAERKVAADTHGKQLIVLALLTPLSLVALASFTLPLPAAWMPMVVFALGTLASVAAIRHVRRARAERSVALVLGGREDRLDLRIRPPEVEASAAGPYRGASRVPTGAPAPSVQRNDGLMAILSFALFGSAPPAAWLYLQACPVVVIDNGGLPAQVSIDDHPLPYLPGGESSVLHLRVGHHRITVTGSSLKGADGETTVHLGWGTASLFSVQPGACHRRFGQYSGGTLAWLSPETDERWFPIADENQVIRIPCVDLPPRPKALLRR